MRNNVRFVAGGLVACLCVWGAIAQDKPTATRPTTAPTSQPSSSPWSEASGDGLQTRLAWVTKEVRAGKPIFFKAQLRHKDGQEWERAAREQYEGAIIVKDAQGKVALRLPVHLAFYNVLQAGQELCLGVFIVGSSCTDLNPGAYTLTLEQAGKPTAASLPTAGPLEFVLPPMPASAPSDDTLKPDYLQAEEIRPFLQGNSWCFGLLTEHGKSVVPGLAALVETGDDELYAKAYTRYWQIAALTLGNIGDKRAGAFLLKRLNDPGAKKDDSYIVSLGKLGVKDAVPLLVEQLRNLDDRGWEVMSRHGESYADRYIDPLESITGQRIPIKVEVMVIDKEATLKAVNEWWAKEDHKKYVTPQTKPASDK